MFVRIEALPTADASLRLPHRAWMRDGAPSHPIDEDLWLGTPTACGAQNDKSSISRFPILAPPRMRHTQVRAFPPLRREANTPQGWGTQVRALRPLRAGGPPNLGIHIPSSGCGVPRPSSARAGKLDSWLLSHLMPKAHAFAFPRSPFRLDLDCTFDSGCVMPETRPQTIFGLPGQSAHDRIPVHIAQLLYPLGFGVKVEVIIARLPEGFGMAKGEPARHRLLQGLHGSGERCLLRFAQQKVNMLRHDHIARSRRIRTRAASVPARVRRGFVPTTSQT
jgi:hypothetical protein